MKSNDENEIKPIHVNFDYSFDVCIKLSVFINQALRKMASK